MPRLLPLAAIASLLLVAFQCDQPRYDGPDIDFGPGAGITYRDARGRFTHTQDPSDWTSDTTWNAQELAQVGNFNSPQQPGAVSYSLAYPNPGAAGQVTWYLKLSPTALSPCHVVARLVDKRYNLIDGYVADLAAGDSLRFAPRGYNPEQLYRLYYLITNSKGLVYKGHGDIRFTP